jgi:hypothetical protein
MMTAKPDRLLILMNEEALTLASETMGLPDGAKVFVAGRSLVQMTLAELALPGAEMIWTDFRQSASLSALHVTVLAAGGLDRLVLAGDGRKSEAMFSLMCAVLTFLPALRRRRGSQIALVVSSGPAVDSLTAFLGRIEPRLAGQGISVSLRVRDERSVRAGA